MITKRFFRRCVSAGAGFSLSAVLVFFLGACGDGNTSVSVVPLAPFVPVIPVVPEVPVAPVVAANTVTVTAPADGELLAYVGQAKSFTLIFRASQGTASNLMLSLPPIPGLRAANDVVQCAAVDTSDMCRLQISYTPAAPAASSSARFSYTYTDSTGAAREGAYSLAYRVLPPNAVVVSQQPDGMLRGIVGRTLPVTLAFGTSDGESATSLTLTTDLAGLPAGWKSNQAAFACASLGLSQPCGLMLAYSPLAPEAGARLALAYRYVDSSGVPRSGTASVDYSAIRAGSVGTSLDTVGPLLARPGESKEITVRFSVSDGVRAGALRLDTDLAATPGWRIAPGWQGCATVEGSDSCKLTLVFAPSLALGPATLPLSYTYIDNIGEARSASVDIAYTSRLYEAYIADYRDDGPGAVRQCTVAADGGLSDCMAAQVALPAQGRSISHVVASGRQAYVSSLAASDRSSVFLCAIAINGALQDCRETGNVGKGVRQLVLHGASAYLLTGEGKILRQDVDVATGEIMPCPASRGSCEAAGTSSSVATLAIDGANAYLARTGPNAEKLEVVRCTFLANADINCSEPAFLLDDRFTAGASATFRQDNVLRLYIVGEPYFALLDGTHAVIGCDLFPNGAVSGCGGDAVATIDSNVTGTDALYRGISFDRGHAYIVQEASIFLCGVDVDNGKLPNCNAVRGTGATRHFAVSINRIN